MTIKPQFNIMTESRGAHWIAWVTKADSDKPLDSIILVGQTQDEASSQARKWAEKLTSDPVLVRS